MRYRSDAEWARRLREVQTAEVVASECDLYGHDYQVREYDYRRALRIPESVFCGRCGMSWKVER